MKRISGIALRLWVWILFAILCIAPPTYAQQTGEIIWENEFPAVGGIGQSIPDNFVVNSGGVQATLTYQTDGDDSAQTSLPFDDFLTFFEGFAFGGETGVALITHNSAVINQDNHLTINLSFDQPVFNLSFDMLHFDQPNAGTQFGAGDEGLQIFFDDGTGSQQTLLDNPDFFDLSGDAIIPDNDPDVTGWEGNASLGFTAATANLNVDFGNQPVQNVTIEVYAADGSQPDPNLLVAGMGDISWVDGGSDLSTTVATSSSIPFVTSLVTNSVNITNSGPEMASGVTVDIPLPNGLAFDSDDSNGDYDSTIGLWTIGDLAVGETATINIISTVQPTGPYTFLAEVASNDTMDIDSTPGNRLTNPTEDDTDSLTLTPRPNTPLLSCNGRLIQVLTFENPTLTSSSENTSGQVYRYDNIAANVSADVTVLPSTNGASLETIDDDGPFTGDPENEALIASFQPVLDTNGDSAVNLQFDFFFTDTGLPAFIDFAASSIDVDGNGGAIVEYVDYESTFVESLFNASTVLTEINPSPANPNRTRFQSTDFDAATGVDRSAIENIVTVFYTDTSSFTVSLGATGTFDGRLTSMAFDCPNIGVAVTNAVIDEDFGDAPLANYGNPIHTLVAGFLLGATNTAEEQSFDSSTANGDVGDDGASPPDFTGGTNVSFDVDATGAGGFLQVWVDWNIDGDFDDTGEQIITDLQDTDNDGVIPVSVTPPAGLSEGDSFIRLRWSTASGLTPGEAAADGEVEDYAISLMLGVTGLSAVKTVKALDGDYSIPGNDVTYTITVSNTGATNIDNDTIFLVDNFPSDLEYVFDDANGSADGTDEIIFTENTPTGLTFDPATDIGFSTGTTAPTSLAECDDPVTSGANPNVTFICFNPKGSLLAAATPPSFSFSFRARIR